MSKAYFVYMITNRHNTVLYIGVTGNLEVRIHQHKQGEGGVFTKKYKCTKLVWYTAFEDVHGALQKEKNMKHYSRQWKENLINEMNPDWKDLFDDMFLGG